MWLLQTDVNLDNISDNIGEGSGAGKFIDGFKKSVADAFDVNRFQTFFIQLENAAQKYSRSIASNVGVYSQQMQTAMYNVAKETQKIGGNMDMVVDYMSEFAGAIDKVPSIQEDVIKNAIALSVVTGMSVKEIGKFSASVYQVGGGQQFAMEMLNNTYKTAKKFGLDAKKLTETVTTNIQKSSTYGFKDGVAGLTRMAAEAQRLGISMDRTMKIAEKAFDPEDAIKLASEMQMLGGEVGALADPFQLMYLAQNDVEGLQKEFVKAASGAATFNQKTGQFQISGEQMRRLRAQAEALGLSYDEIADTAIKAAKEQEVLSKVSFGQGFTEDEKSLIASMSEMKDGEWKLRVKDESGKEQWIAAGQVSKEQLQSIENSQTEQNKSIEQLARDQLSVSEKQVNVLNEVRDAIIFSTKGRAGGKTAVDIAETVTAATEKAVPPMQNSTVVETMLSYLSQAADAVNFYVNDASGLQTDIRTIINNLETNPPEVENAIRRAEDAIIPSSNQGPTVMAKGEIFQGIPGDGVLMAYDLENWIEKVNNLGEEGKKMKGVMAKPVNNFESALQKSPVNEINRVEQNINTTNTTEVTGNVGINVSPIRIDMPSGTLANAITNDRDFQMKLTQEIIRVFNDMPNISKIMGK